MPSKCYLKIICSYFNHSSRRSLLLLFKKLSVCIFKKYSKITLWFLLKAFVSQTFLKIFGNDLDDI